MGWRQKDDSDCQAFGCRRKATSPGEDKKPDGLCSPHRTGAKLRQANEVKLQAQYEAARRSDRKRRAQSAYREQWRKDHADEAYGATFVCLLCGKALQDVLSKTPSEIGERFVIDTEYGPRSETVKAHQAAHGQDWIDFQRAWTETE